MSKLNHNKATRTLFVNTIFPVVDVINSRIEIDQQIDQSVDPPEYLVHMFKLKPPQGVPQIFY